MSHEEYEIPCGNPVVVCIGMKLDGYEFEVVVPENDRRRKVADQKIDGE